MECLNRDKRMIVRRDSALSRSLEKRLLDESAPATVILGKKTTKNSSSKPHIQSATSNVYLSTWIIIWPAGVLAADHCNNKTWD